MARAYRLMSSDGHLEVPPERWVHRVPEKYRDRAPRTVQLPDGGDALLIEGQPLAKGSYTIWSIPDSAKWTVIFTNALHVWHRPYPGESHDVLRVQVAPEHGDYLEVLVYYFPVVGPDSATLRFQWGTTIVPLHIHTR